MLVYLAEGLRVSCSLAYPKRVICFLTCGDEVYLFILCEGSYFEEGAVEGGRVLKTEGC